MYNSFYNCFGQKIDPKTIISYQDVIIELQALFKRRLLKQISIKN